MAGASIRARLDRRAATPVILVAVGSFVVLAGGFPHLADTPYRLATLLSLLVLLIAWLALAVGDQRWRPDRSLAIGVLAVLGASTLATALSDSLRMSAETLVTASIDGGVFLALTRFAAHPWFRGFVRAVLIAFPMAIAIAYLAQVVAAWIRWWGAVGAIVVPPLRPFDVSLYLDASPAVAAVLVATVPVAVALLARAGRRGLAAALGLVVVASIDVLLTGSRAAYVGLGIEAIAGIAIVGVAVARGRSGVRSLRRRQALAGLGGLLVLAVGIAVLAGPLLVRILDLRTILQRFDLWSAAVTLFRSSPIVGHGPGMWPMLKFAAEPAGVPNLVLPHAHNVVLQVAAEDGLVGLAAVALLAVSLGRVLVRGMRSRDPETRAAAATAAVGVAGFAATSMFDAFTLLRGVTYPALLAVAWAIGRIDGWDARRPSSGVHRAREATVVARAGRPATIVALVLAVVTVPLVVRAGQAALASDAGVNALWRHDWVAARSSFDEALAFDPAFPLHRLEVATVDAHADPGSVRAADLLRSVVALDGNPRNLLSLAWLDLRAGRTADAVALARTAYGRTSADTGVSLNVGAIAEAAGDRALALAGYRNALLTSPSIAADPRFGSGLGGEALTTLLADRERSGDTIGVALLLAYTGHATEAVAMLRPGVRTAARDRGLAIALVLAGSPADAARVLVPALLHTPSDGSLAGLLAGVEAKAGDKAARARYTTWAEGIGISGGDIASLSGLRIARAGETGSSDFPRNYPWAVYLRMTPPILTPPDYLVITSR